MGERPLAVRELAVMFWQGQTGRRCIQVVTFPADVVCMRGRGSGGRGRFCVADRVSGHFETGIPTAHNLYYVCDIPIVKLFLVCLLDVRSLQGY